MERVGDKVILFISFNYNGIFDFNPDICSPILGKFINDYALVEIKKDGN